MIYLYRLIARDYRRDIGVIDGIWTVRVINGVINMRIAASRISHGKLPFVACTEPHVAHRQRLLINKLKRKRISACEYKRISSLLPPLLIPQGFSVDTHAAVEGNEGENRT